MKAFFILAICLTTQHVFAMGTPPMLEGSPLSYQEKQDVNTIQETTRATNQFAKDRWHRDQQHMEDKEFAALRKQEEEQAKRKEVPKGAPLPAPGEMKINFE